MGGGGQAQDNRLLLLFYYCEDRCCSVVSGCRLPVQSMYSGSVFTGAARCCPSDYLQFPWLVADDLASSAYQFQGTLGERSISLDEVARPLIATLPILR